MSQLLMHAITFLLILPAIVLHEVSHGYVAYLLGDPTAKRAGRLSLNPIKHIDPFGTLILPAILILSSGMAFGYAKPVPVNPRYFRNYRTGFFISSLAGPAMNLTLALVASAGVRLVGMQGILGNVLFLFAYMNLILMFFNLIPIPPLDGSRVIPLFLSDRGMRTYARAEQYGFGILLLLLFGLPFLLRIDPLSWYLDATAGRLVALLTGV